MFWYWFGFSGFLVLIISGFFGLKMFNINLPKSLCVRHFVFSAFIDAFYISIAYSHLLCQFIFGGLCLLTIFMNLSVNFVNSDKIQPVKRFELLFDFLCVIGITIYLLYLIPNESLQSIMIPVISAVYGGLLTLIGVAWTIKNSYEIFNKDLEYKQTEKHEKHKQEIEPSFAIYQNFYTNDIRKMVFEKDRGSSQMLLEGIIYNTVKVGFYIKGLEIDSIIYKNITHEEYVKECSTIQIVLHSKTIEEIKNVKLHVEDLDRNKLIYILNIEQKNNYYRVISYEKEDVKYGNITR